MNREASKDKFIALGHASLGMTQVQKSDKDVPNEGPAYMIDRARWANAYDANTHQQLIDSAALLRHLARRPNRYANKFGSLSPEEMAIVLTEYNRGGTPSPSNFAESGNYGRRFLSGYHDIVQALKPQNRGPKNL